MASSKASEVLSRGQAARLWRMYGLKSPEDLTLEDIAFANGVVVMEGKLDGAEARLIRSDSHGIIRVSDEISQPGRRRFAIAHELGHWFLHAKLSQVLACTSEDMVVKYKASPPELEANYFASELLMPSFLFGELIRNEAPSLRLIEQLAAEFGTSLTAAAIRYVEQQDDYCAVVFSENGKIRWWRISGSFGSGTWIDPGMPLSDRTLASSLFRGEAIGVKPQYVDLDAWFSNTDLHCHTIIEHSMLLGNTGQAMSLLWLP